MYDENQGNYNKTRDVHGTYVLATLRQIAPAANYIFIETFDNALKKQDAVKWIQNNSVSLGIDFLAISWQGYDNNDWYNWFQNLTDYGVITVSATGNGDRIYYGSASAEFPSSFNNTIGVTGVYDNIHGSSSDHWTRAYKANSGYGVDIASIANATKLDWSPAIGCSEFNGTSNAAPIVTGILALIKQYQNNYKPSDELNFALVTTLFEETGDEPGCAPSTNTSEVSGYLDWINEYNNDTYYPDFPYQYADFSEYTYGWGIIDAYEIFEYFKENY